MLGYGPVEVDRYTFEVGEFTPVDDRADGTGNGNKLIHELC
jgi:hypothetical protein